MKKIFCAVMGILVLFGCSKSLGCFEEGTRDMDALYEDIAAHIQDGDWKMALLDETWWSKARIEKEYQLDLTKVEEAYVKSSAMEAECGEIAIFKVAKSQEAEVLKAITHRLDALKTTWGDYLLDADEQLQDVQMGRIGQYYYMILGEDSKKVVNYIHDMK